MQINLTVFIEINGISTYVGDIKGNSPENAQFAYAEEYLKNPESRPVSISLPLKKTPFSTENTRIFFEGLLPEGFTRRCVAGWIHVDENDYLSILAKLGNECLGAIKIIAEGSSEITPDYLSLSDQEVKKLAREGAVESAQLVTKAHLSLTGASGKVGLYYNESDCQWYLPVGNAPSTHIVKQSHVRLKEIVINEQLCLLTAQNLGIDISESFIINTGNYADEDVLFATRRYDRQICTDNKRINGLPVPYRLPQEDFAQALGIPASAKYEKDHGDYLKRMFDLLRIYSSDPVADQLKLWDICIFNFLIGNTDNHIKNVSLLYGPDLNSVHLAPAYDIISTVIYESSTDNMALSIGGLYRIGDISRQAFADEAGKIGLGTPIAMKHFDDMAEHFKNAINKAQEMLEKQKMVQVNSMKEEILLKGGISNL